METLTESFEDFFILSEARKKIGNDKGKIIKMNTNDILVQVKKSRSNKDDKFSYSIIISDINDPNIKGQIRYDTNEAMKHVYRSINSVPTLLNMIHRYIKSYECYSLVSIYNKEIMYLKKHLSQTELDDLNLDFILISVKKDDGTSDSLKDSFGMDKGPSLSSTKTPMTGMESSSEEELPEVSETEVPSMESSPEAETE